MNHSNQRLAEHLRRIVDTRNVIESRRVQALTGEIKHIISQLGDDLIALMNRRASFFVIEAEPDVDLPLERPLFDPPLKTEPSQRPHTASAFIDIDALITLYDTFYIDDALLDDNISRLLMSRSEVTLAELVTSYPVKQGIAEIIAYLQIAARNSRHDIDRTTQDAITINTRNGEEKSVVVPRIIFRRAVHQTEV